MRRLSLSSAFFALQKVVKLQAAHGFVAHVAGVADHDANPAHCGPSTSAAALPWSMLAIIVAREMAAGLLAAKGAFDLFKARSGTADEFDAAKNVASIGGGVTTIVGFGLFSTTAGGRFRMWQTDAGPIALREASIFSVQKWGRAAGARVEGRLAGHRPRASAAGRPATPWDIECAD